MAKHFIVMPAGSAGDVHPFAGLGIELMRRGYRVTMATNGHFRSLSERFGLPFEEISSAEDFRESIQNPDLWSPTRSFPYIFRKLIAPTIRRQFDLIERHYEPGNTVVLANCFGMGALCAQEKLGVPVVSVHLQPGVIWSNIAPPRSPATIGPLWMQRWIFAQAQRYIIDPIVNPTLNGFRAQLGLSPIEHVLQWWHSKTLTVCLFPEWYAAPQSDWPSPLRQTDFPLWDERDTDRLPDRIQSFLDRGSPPIACTPGSANVFGKKFFEVVIEAGRRIGRRCILLTRYPEQLPASLPDHVLHVDFVPLSQLLPRCAAFVYHGGIGSASQAIAAGIPHLIWPLAHDQFDNAKRLEDQGVARSLSPRWFTPKRVAAKLRELTESGVVLKTCKTLATRLEYGRGIAQAASLVEETTQTLQTS